MTFERSRNRFQGNARHSAKVFNVIRKIIGGSWFGDSFWIGDLVIMLSDASDNIGPEV